MNIVVAYIENVSLNKNDKQIIVTNLKTGNRNKKPLDVCKLNTY